MKKKAKSQKAPQGYVNPHADSNLLDIPRLTRLIGQLEGVKRMIEEKRHCYEIIHQLRAVGNGTRALEAKILDNHIEHLLDEVLEQPHPARFESKKRDLMNVLKGKLLIAP